MFEIFAIKSALFVAVKNAAATLAWSIPFAVVIAAIPAFNVDLMAYGMFGGLTRWLALKCGLVDGLCGVGIGALMGVGFEGASAPFVQSWVVGEIQQAHVSAYVFGLLGNIVYDALVNLVAVKLRGLK